MYGRKGIVLAGGLGTRLRPATLAISKHLLHVYDKPMIYYSLSLLMLAGIKDILIISTPYDIGMYEGILGDGSDWGISLSYQIQNEPKGIAQVFILAETFIGDSPCSLVLGDNILYGYGLPIILHEAASYNEGATVFGYTVREPHRYGLIDFTSDGKVQNIEEKPLHPKSNCAVIGLYFYDNKVVEYAKSLRPSQRDELEITDINLCYLRNNALNAHVLGRGMAWFDAGTAKSLLDAANFFYSLEDRQGLKACCPEEIAWRYGYINDTDLLRLAEKMGPNDYGTYLALLAQSPSMRNPAFYKEEAWMEKFCLPAEEEVL